MKTIKIFVGLGIILFLSAFSLSKTQVPVCAPDYIGISFSVPKILNYPPYSSDMSYDALIGYIVLDSLCMYGNYQDISTFLNRQAYNDSIRTIMRYLYQVVDYNPIKYLQYIYHSKMNQKVLLTSIADNIINKVKKISPKPFIDETLLASSFIAHVIITDTLRKFDSIAAFAKSLQLVSCQIIDTIKGKIIPSCINLYPNNISEKDSKNNSIQGTQRMMIDSCLQFEYALEWPRGGNYGYSTLVDSNGIPWIKKGFEYIVFLETRIICSTDSLFYLTVFPLRQNYSMTVSMYPVLNGHVIDSENEFGFGFNPTTEEFKDSLKTRIQEIITYTP